MTDLERVKNLLGLAKRAGKIVSGEDLVTKAIQSGRCDLVFLAKDLTSNLTKKIEDKTTFYKIPLSKAFSAQELSIAIGSNRSVIAVCDRGFSKKMEHLMQK